MKQEVATVEEKIEHIKINEIKIVVTEIPVKTSRKLLSNFMGYFTGEKTLNFENLIDSEYDLLVEISKDFIKMPDGMSIDDIGYDTLEEEIWPIIQRLNKRFLGKILSGLTMLPETLAPVEEDPQTHSSKDSTKQ